MATPTCPRNTARARCSCGHSSGLTALAAAVRFSTLGLQSYRHDEAVTAGRVLVVGLSQSMHQVWTGESTPPLYYFLAWLWIAPVRGATRWDCARSRRCSGRRRFPVAYLIGRELIGRRVGLVTAAIVAVNPMLVWYSQDARAYALLVLFSAAAFFFFLRARRTGAGLATSLWWAVFSALALATHYFAVFPLAIEAVWLLVTARRARPVLVAIAGVALAGLALAPIALHQARGKSNDWIATFG